MSSSIRPSLPRFMCTRTCVRVCIGVCNVGMLNAMKAVYIYSGHSAEQLEADGLMQSLYHGRAT